MGADEGRVAVTKGQRAGDSAGLFLSLGRRPSDGPRGRNPSSLRGEPPRAAPGFQALALVPCKESWLVFFFSPSFLVPFLFPPRGPP